MGFELTAWTKANRFWLNFAKSICFLRLGLAFVKTSFAQQAIKFRAKAQNSIALGLMVALLSGCSFAPDYTRPELQLPSRFVSTEQEKITFADSPWWNFFNDPVLKDLIAQALDHNKDLLISASRIEQARAQLGIVRSDQFPQVSISGSATRQDLSDNAIGFATNINNNYGIGADLSYQLDFWGKYRNATAAARYQLLATEQGYMNLRISLLSEVARAYFIILDFQNQKAIALGTLKNRKDATGVIKARFQEGILPELDFNQAEIEEADAALTVITADRNIKLARNALAILIGKTELVDSQGNKLEFKLPETAVNFSKDQDFVFLASTLQQRPDVQAAEFQAKAALADVGVAKADQLPNFNILGSIGFASTKGHNLFERPSMTWDIGGQFLGPLIDFGRSESNIEFTEAAAKETLLNYENTVLRASREVEDAIIEIISYNDENVQRNLQVAAAQNASRLSRERYYNGFTSYLEVLDIERSLFSAELASSNTRQKYFSAIVKLYQALGGGWGKSETPEPALKVKIE